jgi:predicted kinase
VARGSDCEQVELPAPGAKAAAADAAALEVVPAGVTWISDEQNGVFRWQGPAPTSMRLPERTVVFLGGQPGVGKGYFAKRLFGDAPYFEYDEYWAKAGKEEQAAPDAAATSDEGDENGAQNTRRSRAWELLLADAAEAAETSPNIVIDACGFWLFQQRMVREFAAEIGADAHLVILTAPRWLCEQGQVERGFRVRASEDMDLYEERWEGMQTAIKRGRLNEQGFAAVTVIDRLHADALQEIRFKGGPEAPKRWQLPYKLRH